MLYLRKMKYQAEIITKTPACKPSLVLTDRLVCSVFINLTFSFMVHDITVCFAAFYCRLFFYLVDRKESGRNVGIAGGADESTGEKVSARVK